jgi:hypothetical protein
MDGDRHPRQRLAENLSRSLRTSELSLEELTDGIVLAQLILAGIEPRLPVQAMFLLLAKSVLTLFEGVKSS